MARSRLEKLKTKAIGKGADIVESVSKRERKRRARNRVERKATEMERRAATRDAREEVGRLDEETGIPSKFKSVKSKVRGAAESGISAARSGVDSLEVDEPDRGRSRSGKDPVERAGEAAQMGAPIGDATLAPTDRPDQLGDLATGGSSRDQSGTLGDMAAGSGGTGIDSLVSFGGDDSGGGAGGLEEMATFGGSMTAEDDSDDSDDPLSVDDSFVFGGDE